MSYDVFLMRVPPEISTLEELQELSSPLELGAKSEVCTALAKVVPEIAFREPDWGVLQTEEFSIEFNIGDKDPVIMLALHIRGGDQAIDVLQAICEATGWHALDGSTPSGFIDFAQNPPAGLQEWRAYRDRVLGVKGSRQ